MSMPISGPEPSKDKSLIQQESDAAAAAAQNQTSHDITMGAGTNVLINGAQNIIETGKSLIISKQLVEMGAPPPQTSPEKASGITMGVSDGTPASTPPSAAPAPAPAPAPTPVGSAPAPASTPAPADSTPTTPAPATGSTSDSTGGADEPTDILSLPPSTQALVAQLTPQELEEAYYGEALYTTQSALSALAACAAALRAVPPPSAEALGKINTDINNAYAQLKSAKDTLAKYAPADNSPFAQAVQDVMNKIQRFTDGLPPPATNSDLQDWASKITIQQTKAVSDESMLIGALATLGNEIHLPEPPLWSDISKIILGSMMKKLQASLSNVEHLVAAESQMFNRLGTMLSELVKWGVGDVKAPVAFTIPTVADTFVKGVENPEWVKFRLELANLKNFKANGMNTWFANMQKDLVAMQANAQGHPSMQGHVNSLWAQLRNMKKVVSAVANLTIGQFVNSKGVPQSPVVKLFYTDADGKHVILKTPGGLTSFETITVKTMNGGVTKVREPKYKPLTKSIGIKTLLKKFSTNIAGFKGKVQDDHAAIESLSTTTQSNMRLGMMYMQEMYQVAPQLIQTLAELGKALAQHMDGK